MPPVAPSVALYVELTTPPGSAAVVIPSVTVIVNDSVLLAVRCVGLLESVTVSVTLFVPAAVGVPLMTPVDVLILTPGGSPVADHVYGGVPPLATTVAL